MHIVLVGVKPEISDPHFKFHVCGTFEEVKESSQILMPEYVLIHEDEARSILPLAEEMVGSLIVVDGKKCVVKDVVVRQDGDIKLIV